MLRPRLPPSERLLPYLKRIDESRVYSNWGPLVREFESRLSALWGLQPATVASTGSGTAALVGSILAFAGRAESSRPLAVVPAFTFAATGVAVQLCGYEPYLADVDRETWMLDPASIAEHAVLDRTGVVIPVAPFGRLSPPGPWHEFRDRTDIPVVIDASASFDRICEEPGTLLSSLPTAVSFHATKTFGTGEGGCVVSTDTAVVQRCVQALNYGFRVERESEMPSLNGKMSEYHAAVGLAELDGWSEKIDALVDVAGYYRTRFEEAGVGDHLVVTPDVSACYVLFHCGDRVVAERVEKRLEEAGIDYRFWYARGIHRHPQFASAARDDLSVTEELASCIIGLPLAQDLDDGSVSRVAEAIARA